MQPHDIGQVTKATMTDDDDDSTDDDAAKTARSAKAVQFGKPRIYGPPAITFIAIAITLACAGTHPTRLYANTNYPKQSAQTTSSHSTIRPNPYLPEIMYGQSVERHPGPEVEVELCNCTHADTNFHLLMKRTAKYTAINEHTIPKHMHEAFTAKVRGHAKDICLSDVDAGMLKAGGGTGLMADGPNQMMCLPDCTPDLTMQCEHGRAAAYLIDIGKDTCACLYNMYGFSGGRDCKQLSIRTDKVFEACWTNHQTHYKGYPAIFTGDLNTDTPNMPFLNKLVDAQKIIDLGAHGSKWGGTDNEYTCISPTTHKPTRNDYILVCPLTWNMVTKFRVQHDQGFPTHSLPIVTLDVGQAAGVHTVSNAPMAIMDALTKLVLQTRVQGRTLSDDARHNSNNT